MSGQINAARQHLDSANFALLGCFSSATLSKAWKPVSSLNVNQSQGYPDCVRTVKNNVTGPVYLGLYLSDGNGLIGNCVYATPSSLKAATDTPLKMSSSCGMDQNGFIIGSSAQSIAIYDLSSSAQPPSVIGAGAVPVKYRGCFDLSSLSYNTSMGSDGQYLARPLLPQGGSVTSFDSCIIAAKNDMAANGTRYKYIASMRAAGGKLTCYGADYIDPSAVQLGSCTISTLPLTTLTGSQPTMDPYVNGGINSVSVYENPFFAGSDVTSSSSVTVNNNSQVVVGDPTPAQPRTFATTPTSTPTPTPTFTPTPTPTSQLVPVPPPSNVATPPPASTTTPVVYTAPVSSVVAAPLTPVAPPTQTQPDPPPTTTTTDPTPDPLDPSTPPPTTFMDKYKMYIIICLVLVVAVIGVIAFLKNK
jgi:hypothetical protein